MDHEHRPPGRLAPSCSTCLKGLAAFLRAHTHTRTSTDASASKPRLFNVWMFARPYDSALGPGSGPSSTIRRGVQLATCQAVAFLAVTERRHFIDIFDMLISTANCSASYFQSRNQNIDACASTISDDVLKPVLEHSPLVWSEEYLSMKVPSWLLSGALALGRMRIKLFGLFASRAAIRFARENVGRSTVGQAGLGSGSALWSYTKGAHPLYICVSSLM